jgi:hypothetical protein
MIQKILLSIIVLASFIGCESPNESEPIERINPLVGDWVLSYISDDQDTYIVGPEGIDGSVLRMDLSDNGTGNTFLLDIWRTKEYSATWSSSGNKLSLNIDENGEFTSSYQLLYSNGKTLDDPPLTVTLVLTGSNQFASFDGSLVFYYRKSQ